MPVIFEGPITGIRKGEWARTPGAAPVKYAVLQFTEKAEDDAIKFIEVNLPDGDDGSTYKVGQTVKLPVRVTAKDKKIYFRATGQDTPAPARPAPKA
jgi:hypothetical protein